MDKKSVSKNSESKEESLITAMGAKSVSSSDMLLLNQLKHGIDPPQITLKKLLKENNIQDVKKYYDLLYSLKPELMLQKLQAEGSRKDQWMKVTESAIKKCGNPSLFKEYLNDYEIGVVINLCENE